MQPNNRRKIGAPARRKSPTQVRSRPKSRSPNQSGHQTSLPPPGPSQAARKGVSGIDAAIHTALSTDPVLIELMERGVIDLMESQVRDRMLPPTLPDPVTSSTSDPS